MKYKIDNLGFYVCEECGISCKQLCNLNRHIGLKHDKDLYYKKYLFEENDGKCVICKNKIRSFNKLSFRNYVKTCSKKCQEKLHSITINNFSEDKINQINLKRIKTCKSKYMVENPMQSEIIKIKYKKTLLTKYGVEHPTQNEMIFKKALNTRRLHKKFKDTDIWYQGSYELDFLEKYYDKFPDIQRGPTIKYFYNDKTKMYFSDFYIPSLNLIIECKSSYTLKLDIEINYKKDAVLEHGYNYIMVLDKNYSEFENVQ